MFQCQFESDLIVAFAGTAMADGISTFLMGNLCQCLGDDRSCVACAEQILFILGIRLETRHDVIIDIFICQIHNIQLGSTCLLGFFFQTVKFRSLSDIAGYGNDFTVVIVFFQPRDDDGSVKAAGIGENYFFNIFFFHDVYLLFFSNVFMIPECTVVFRRSSISCLPWSSLKKHPSALCQRTLTYAVPPLFLSDDRHSIP